MRALTAWILTTTFFLGPSIAQAEKTKLSWLKQPEFLAYELDFTGDKKFIAPGIELVWTYRDKTQFLSSKDPLQRTTLANLFYDHFYKRLDPCYLFEVGTLMDALSTEKKSEVSKKVGDLLKKKKFKAAVVSLNFRKGQGQKPNPKKRRWETASSRGLKVRVDLRDEDWNERSVLLYSTNKWAEECVDFNHVKFKVAKIKNLALFFYKLF